MKARAALGVVLLSLFTTSTFPAHAGRAPLLRYRSLEGKTNIYNLQFESRGEAGTDIMAGNLFVSGKPGPSNIITLSIRGTLTPKRDIPTMPQPPSMVGYYSNPRFMSPIIINDNTAQLDGEGRLLRVVGDWPLTIPLGSIAQTLVEKFPAKAEAKWETEDESAMLDEPLNLGPASLLSPLPSSYAYGFYSGSYGSRPGYGTVAVLRKTRYEIKSNEGGLVTVSKSLSLDSYLLEGSEPRMSAKGSGEFVFDSSLGALTSASFEAKSVVNTESVTRRTTTSLRLKLLDGAERENALRPSSTQTTSAGGVTSSSITPPKKLTREEIDKLAEDLKSGDASVRSMAASKLQSSELSEVPDSLLEFLAEKSAEPDSMLRYAALKVIGDYGTKAQLPLLLKWLKSDDFSCRNAAVRGLGRLKEKSAAEAMADLLASGSDTYQVAEALTKIGPDAEDAVLPLLKEKNIETRRQACRILKQIGTKKSIEPLRDLMLSTDRSLGESAGEAVRGIMARE